MDFVFWLEALPAATVGKLYGSQWACQAVLRSLPPLAKQYVARMLFVETPIPSRIIQLWATAAAASKHLAALERLKRLQLLVSTPTSSKEQGYSLHPVFRQQLQGAVTTRAGAADDNAERPDASDVPSRQQLSSYAQDQWETMLLYLVGTVDRLPPASPLLKGTRLPVDSILEGAGLMAGQKKERRITDAGFQYLLLDTYSQLWRLLREYIASGEEVSGAPLGAILNFLLQLGFRDVGSAFRVGALSSVERTIAADVAQLGLLMPFMSGGDVWVATTRLALALAAGGAGQAKRDGNEGFIVVETNYRVYAYTTSQLQTAILRLFTRCECILPNLFVGVLTRESVVGALASGLSADQIVGYLRQHAHPHVAARSPVVPEVVADQVRLWQADTQRVRHDRAVLYDDFPSQEVFLRSGQKARELGAWLWEDPKAGMGRLAVLESGHDKMREYIRSIK